MVEAPLKYCCLRFTLSLKRSIWEFHDAIWETSAKKNCTRMRAASAAQLFFLIQPIRSLFSGVVAAVAIVLAGPCD